MNAKRLIIAGASGVVGRHLATHALDEGWQVSALSRNPASEWDGPAQVIRHKWDPAAPDLDELASHLANTTVLANLAGATLAEGRLGKGHRERILRSRLDATTALTRAHALAENPPPVWLQASAVGFYGETGDSDVTENDPSGSMFLSDVCGQWESAVSEVNARVVLLRIGLVLASDAPAWQKMLLPIKLGVGGNLGPGTQWYGWITARDLARACLFLADLDDAKGPYNLATPHPITQGDLTRETAKILGRPAIFPAPAFILRLVLGAVADELLLPSCRALPARLQDAGFQWEHAQFKDALPTLLA